MKLKEAEKGAEAGGRGEVHVFYWVGALEMALPTLPAFGGRGLGDTSGSSGEARSGGACGWGHRKCDLDISQALRHLVFLL